MKFTTTKSRLIVALETRPKLPHYVRLKEDRARGRWVILAPEKILAPNDIAIDVLKLCDGSREVCVIAETLAIEYSAPVDLILEDILTLLQDLSDKGYIIDGRA